MIAGLLNWAVRYSLKMINVLGIDAETHGVNIDTKRDMLAER